MEHRAMAARTTLESVTFDNALESPAFRYASHIDDLVRLEVFGGDLVASLEVAVATAQLEFAAVLDPVRASLLQVARRGFVDPGGLDVFHQANLNGVIAVARRRLALRDHAWTGLH